MFQGKLKNKDINLLDVYKQKSEPSKYEELIKYALPPLGIVIVFGSLFAYFKFGEIKSLNEIENINEQIAKIEKEQNKDGQQEKYQQLQTLTTEYNRLAVLYANMNSYPQITENIVSGIFQATGSTVEVRSLNYSQDSSVITLSLRTPYLSQTDAVIRRLKETDLFADVQYSGYTSADLISSSDSTQSSSTSSTNNQPTDISKMTDKELREYLAQLQNGGTQEQTTTKNQNSNKTNSSTAVSKAYDITVSCIMKSVVEQE